MGKDGGGTKSKGKGGGGGGGAAVTVTGTTAAPAAAVTVTGTTAAPAAIPVQTPVTPAAPPAPVYKEFAWAKEAGAYMNSVYDPWAYSVSATEKQAFTSYTGMPPYYPHSSNPLPTMEKGHRAINAAMRGTNENLLKGTQPKDLKIAKQQGKAMAAAIEAAPRLPENVTAYRAFRNFNLDNLAPGATFDDKGFSSTTVDKNHHWLGQTGGEAVVRLPKGTKGVFLQHVGKTPQESEFLLQAGTKFRYLGKTTGPKGQLWHEVEVVVDG